MRSHSAEYALEKLGEAVQVLVTQDGRAALRVARAAEHLLMINPSSMPPDLRPRFEKLMKWLLQRPGSRAAFNLKGVRSRTASRRALEIYSLEIELRSHLDR